MPAPKRYFHCSQEIIADPEMWEFTDQFGDRSIRTWLQILIYLDRSANQWRLAGDWLAVLSRTVRQSSANLRRQIGWLVEKRWLVVGEQSADGSPLVLKSPNWLKYNRTQEHKRNLSIPDKGAVNDPLLSFPSPTPILSSPILKNKDKIKNKSCGQVKTVPAIPKSAATWDAYSKNFMMRYGVEPVRNQKTNSLLCALVDRLGESDAPSVAEFYLTHNGPLYVRCRHPPNLLVQDAESLWTQWKTGRKVTTSEIKQAELKDDSQEQVKRVEAMLARGL